MRKTRLLTLIAIFATLFASCGIFSKKDISKFKELKTLTGNSGRVTSVCWSPDGKYLASGAGGLVGDEESVGELFIWDAKSGEKLKTLEGHSWSVKSVSWSPDGKYLASGSWDYNTDEEVGIIKIWDAIGGKEIQTLKEHSSEVWSVSWSPDGKHLASGSADETVVIWGTE